MLGDDHSLLHRWMGTDRRFDFAFSGGGPADNQCKILLVYRIVLELVRKMPLRGHIGAIEQYAAGFLIEAMDNPYARIDRARARKRKLNRQPFQDSIALPAAWNNRQSRRLVDRKDRAASEQDREKIVASTQRFTRLPFLHPLLAIQLG